MLLLTPTRDRDGSPYSSALIRIAYTVTEDSALLQRFAMLEGPIRESRDRFTALCLEVWELVNAGKKKSSQILFFVNRSTKLDPVSFLIRELVLGSSMKMREIAERCGYSDQHYFSYCFKKYCGVSPNAMRQEKE